MGRILVVDDNAALRLTMARILQDAGHLVELAVDGQQCLEKLRSYRPDVIIMDLYMPIKEGLETLIELRKEFPDLAVVAMSGHRVGASMLSSARMLGAIRTLAKPFEPEELLALVSEELDWVAARSRMKTVDACEPERDK